MSRRPRSAALIAMAFAISGCSMFSEWERTDAGTAVIHSDTGVSFTGNWTCNPHRLATSGSNADELSVNFEIQNDGSFKFCGLGDCGMQQSLGPDQGEVNPDSCVGRFELPEPLGARKLVVNGQEIDVFDNRS